jgi:ABC-type sugar transport system substrate-binding protein
VGSNTGRDGRDKWRVHARTATIAQNPMNMGRFGVENALKVKKGETIDAVIDTGTVLVTKENAADFK